MRRSSSTQPLSQSDIIKHVFSYLTLFELGRFAPVSKVWNAASYLRSSLHPEPLVLKVGCSSDGWEFSSRIWSPECHWSENYGVAYSKLSHRRLEQFSNYVMTMLFWETGGRSTFDHNGFPNLKQIVIYDPVRMEHEPFLQEMLDRDVMVMLCDPQELFGSEFWNGKCFPKIRSLKADDVC